MKIEEYVKRKLHPREGDIVIIQGALYQVVDSSKIIGLFESDTCKSCYFNHKKIRGKICIYSYIENVYNSCSEFIREPYMLKKVRKRFKGI